MRVVPVSSELVTLDEATHVYTAGEGLTEKHPPSFSQVMKSAGLATDYGDVDPVVLEFAARVGTLTHEMIEEFLNLGDPENVTVYETGLIAKNAWERYDKFQKWIKNHDLKPVFTESPAYQPDLGYCCTADYIGLLDDEIWVIDWKTTSKIARNVGYQTMAQELCFNFDFVENLRSGPVKRGALWLPKRGEPQLIEFRDDDFDEFTVHAAAQCWKAKAA